MNDCLVTKLKASINDASLEKLGYAPFEGAVDVYSDGTTWIDIVFSKPSKVILEKGSLINSSVAPNGNVYEAQSFTANAQVGQIKINFDKYNIVKINAMVRGYSGKGIDINSLKYSTNIDTINNIPSIYGDISALSNLKELQNLSLGMSADDSLLLTGNISSLRNLKKVTRLSLDRRTLIEGNIADLGSCTSLEWFQIGGTKIRGTIESFVQAQRLNGRTEGSITTPYLGACRGLTFNGAAITIVGNSKIEWTATTISLNGVTVTA